MKINRSPVASFSSHIFLLGAKVAISCGNGNRFLSGTETVFLGAYLPRPPPPPPALTRLFIEAFLCV